MFSPVDSVNRLVDQGRSPPSLREVQTGNWLGENDVVPSDELHRRLAGSAPES
jgi:hypothetical protein